MLFAWLRRLACSAAVLLAAVLLTTSLPRVSFAAGLSDGDSSSSSSRRSARSSNSDDDDEDFGDDSDSDDSSSDSRRSSRSSKASRASSASKSSSSSRSSRSSSRRSSSRGGSSKYTPPAVVFGQSYERFGVRPRGTLISVEAFEDMPGKVERTTVGGTTYYRRGDVWYNQVNHEGWVCYSEIYPPAGVTVDAIPSAHEQVVATGRTLYATDDAFYEIVKQGGRTRYMVVEPAEGVALDRLPLRAKEGIPVQSGRNTYYRYLGVFYREDESSGAARYVVSPNPFMQTPATATAKASPSAVSTATGAYVEIPQP